VKDAREDLEQAERDARKAAEQLDLARDALRTWELQQKRAKLAALIGQLAQWEAALNSAGARLVELDRAVEAVVYQTIGPATKISISKYEEAQKLATEIGEGVRFTIEHKPPSLAEGRLRTSR
jgi:hypothetical protein